MDRNNKLFFAVLVTGGLLIYLLPESLFFSDTSLCVHYRLFGIECPFCGLSRAGFAFLHFQFSKAMHLNPVILPVALVIINEIFRRITQKPIFTITNKILMILTAIAFIALYITRIKNGTM